MAKNPSAGFYSVAYNPLARALGLTGRFGVLAKTSTVAALLWFGLVACAGERMLFEDSQGDYIKCTQTAVRDYCETPGCIEQSEDRCSSEAVAPKSVTSAPLSAAGQACLAAIQARQLSGQEAIDAAARCLLLHSERVSDEAASAKQ